MLPRLPSLSAMPSSSGSSSASNAVTAPGCVQRRASLAKLPAHARISALAGTRGMRDSSVPCSTDSLVARTRPKGPLSVSSCSSTTPKAYRLGAGPSENPELGSTYAMSECQGLLCMVAAAAAAHGVLTMPSPHPPAPPPVEASRWFSRAGRTDTLVLWASRVTMEGDTSVRSAYAESTSGTAACWSAWEAPPQPSPSSAAPSSAPDHADSEQLSPPPPLPAPAKAALLLTCAWVLAAPLPVVHALWRFRSCKNVRALQMSVAMRPTWRQLMRPRSSCVASVRSPKRSSTTHSVCG
mmetsp:Transcript_6849/g.18384  ORF Transcript_6849/g.18384 Transcript_6849/m.18384 type:complete len:296 (+) Transcript_6849:2460-3347(+)